MSVGNFMDTNKKSSNLLELFSGVRGLVIGAAALLAKNPDPGARVKCIKNKNRNLSVSVCGAYGTRTRDPMRDRHVF